MFQSSVLYLAQNVGNYLNICEKFSYSLTFSKTSSRRRILSLLGKVYIEQYMYKWQTKITTFLNNQPQLSNQFPINSLSTEKDKVVSIHHGQCAAVLLIKLKCSSFHMLQVSRQNIVSLLSLPSTVMDQTSCTIEFSRKEWLTFPLYPYNRACNYFTKSIYLSLLYNLYKCFDTKLNHTDIGH